MREILFKGKRKDNGEWIFRDNIAKCSYTTDDKTGEVICIDSYYFGNIIVDAKTVGQYTGVTDKNGKKIFEGDIVKGWKATGELDFEKAVVCWDDFFSQWKVDGGALFGSKICAMYEVIGNIHENLEM